MNPLRLISGLSEIAADYDALICDVWGVIHNGHKAHPDAAEALMRFRKERGPVVLLTNAPRMPAEVAAQCAQYGLPDGCYDAIVCSGGAAHDELARRSAKGKLPLYYLGPDKDRTILEGLDIALTGIREAEIAVCVGLVDDLTETPADYADRLATMRDQDLTMICANPDLVVHRGPQLCYCAGALAQAYEKIGGKAIYYGKPHMPIYDAALAAAHAASAANKQGGAKKPLAVGDALHTDIKGANLAGLDALFIADGVHGEEIPAFTADHLGQMLAGAGTHAVAAARRLTW